MMTPAEYRTYADTAFEDAQEYRDKAETATDATSRDRYLKWADIREDDGCFYLDRAALIEEYEIRHATNQEAA
jgi:hypothetical protein